MRICRSNGEKLMGNKKESWQEQLRKQWQAILDADPNKDKNLTPGELIRKKAREDLRRELDEKNKDKD